VWTSVGVDKAIAAVPTIVSSRPLCGRSSTVVIEVAQESCHDLDGETIS
jgi:hypothetical protein